MADIQIRPLDDEHFEVTIDEGTSQSMHVVTATQKEADLLCDGCDTERLVEASVRFLLDRESKEAIMNQFDLDVIVRFFPDYPSRIADYL